MYIYVYKYQISIFQAINILILHIFRKGLGQILFEISIRNNYLKILNIIRLQIVFYFARLIWILILI